MSAEVQTLLRAVREALTIPLPAVSERDEAAYGRLLQARVSDVRAMIDALLIDGITPETAAGVLRGWTTTSPATYAHWEPDGGPT